MTEDEINELALELYPIQIVLGTDYNFPHRKNFIKALRKASEFLFTKEQVRDAWDDGSWNVKEEDRIKNRELYIQSLKK